MGAHDLDPAGRNTRGGNDDPAGDGEGAGDSAWPRHLTQVRSLPVSATSTKGCAGVPTRSRTKYCPVPVYAPDVSGIANADDASGDDAAASGPVSAARRPWLW
jgi:hypothetical protein